MYCTVQFGTITIILKKKNINQETFKRLNTITGELTLQGTNFIPRGFLETPNPRKKKCNKHHINNVYHGNTM